MSYSKIILRLNFSSAARRQRGCPPAGQAPPAPPDPARAPNDCTVYCNFEMNFHNTVGYCNGLSLGWARLITGIIEQIKFK